MSKEKLIKHKGQAVTVWLEPEDMNQLVEFVKVSKLDKSKVLKSLIRSRTPTAFLSDYVALLQRSDSRND